MKKTIELNKKDNEALMNLIREYHKRPAEERKRKKLAKQLERERNISEIILNAKRDPKFDRWYKDLRKVIGAGLDEHDKNNNK